MIEDLLNKRENAMTCAERAIAESQDNTKGDEFLNAMNSSIKELLEISKDLEKKKAPIIEISRTKAWAAALLAEMEVAIGTEALMLSLNTYREAETLLKGDEDPVFIATLNFNIANIITRYTATDLNLFVNAWQRIQDALSLFDGRHQERFAMAKELAAKIEGLFIVPLLFGGFDSELPEVKILAKHLDDGGRMREVVPLVRQVLKNSGGTAVVMARVESLIEDLPIDIRKSSGFAEIRNEIRKLALSFLPAEDASILDMLSQKVEEEINENEMGSDRADTIKSMVRQIKQVMSSNQGGLQAEQARYGNIGDLLQSQLRTLHYAERPPSGTRAEQLHDLCFSIKSYLTEDGQNTAGDEEGNRRIELLRQITEVSRRICNAGADNGRVLTLEKTEFRPLVFRILKYSERNNPMLAKPKWGNVETALDTNLVFFSGNRSMRGSLEKVCNKIGLELAAPLHGGDNISQSLWKQIQSAMTTVFHIDFKQNPVAIAAATYEMGVASTIGKPRIVLEPLNQTSLFDVDVLTVRLTGKKEENEKVFLAALDQSMCWFHPNRATLNCLKTAEFAGSAYPQKNLHPIAIQMLSELSKCQEIEEADSFVVTRNLKEFVKYLDDDKTRLFFPVWPATYPMSNKRKVFHITRLNPIEWVQRNSKIIKKVCHGLGFEYLRCDEPNDSDIIQSIWNGIAESTHILADFTSFNANVSFELGIAHTLGKPVLLLFQQDDKSSNISNLLKNHFPALARERYYEYANPAQIEKYLKDFLFDDNSNIKS